MNHPQVPGKGLHRIMLVEDDLPLATELKGALERQGYDVLVIDRGAAAQEAAERYRPDLVLLDVMMPGVDGWDVLSRFRANPVTDSLPVIMLTSADSAAAKIKGFALGVDDYITKPFMLAELRCRIAAVLRRTTTGADTHEANAIPVITERKGFELLRPRDFYFAQGVRNYTHVHTFDSRFLCRLGLNDLDDRHIEGFMRVQRSFVVNLEHVKSCGWTNRSRYAIRLGDLARTEISVSRSLVMELQKRLGIRG